MQLVNRFLTQRGTLYLDVFAIGCGTFWVFHVSNKERLRLPNEFLLGSGDKEGCFYGEMLL